MYRIEHEKSVQFFTAYHILRDGAETALGLCREEGASEAAKILSEALADAEKYYYDSIDRYATENSSMEAAKKLLISDK